MKKKRKQLCCSISQILKLLEKLDKDVSVKRLTEEFGVETTTIYELRKQVKLLKFYDESDEKKLMKYRKTLYRVTYDDFERALMNWIHQRQTEHMSLIYNYLPGICISFVMKCKWISRLCLGTIPKLTYFMDVT